MTAPEAVGAEAPTLHPHQVEAVAYFREHARGVLADEVGLGKSVTAMAIVADALSVRGDATGRPFALLVVPATLITQTLAEAERFLPPGTTVAGAFGAAGLELAREGAADVVVIGQQALAREPLEDVAPELLILDEASEFRTGPMGGREPTRLWENVRSLAEVVPRVVALTATSVEKHPIDAYEILRAINAPGLPSPRRFAEAFEWEPGFVTSRGQQPPRPAGFINDVAASWVATELNRHILRRTVEDVGLSLPVRTGERYWFVDLTAGQQAAYDRGTRATGLYGHHKRKAAGRAHAGSSSLVWFGVEDIRAHDEKVIVYAENLHVLTLVSEMLNDHGIAWVRIDGSVKDERRTAALAAFADPGGPRVLLGNAVLERGLNIQHCRRLITLDPGFNPARERQREGRICRLGSPHATYEHLTVLPNTPDARAKWELLASRRAMAAAVGL